MKIIALALLATLASCTPPGLIVAHPYKGLPQAARVIGKTDLTGRTHVYKMVSDDGTVLYVAERAGSSVSIAVVQK